MSTKYRATFSDGSVLTRTTVSRTYTHAYLLRLELTQAGADHRKSLGHWSEKFCQAGRISESKGFSGSLQLANKALASAQKNTNYLHWRTLLAETTPLQTI